MKYTDHALYNTLK